MEYGPKPFASSCFSGSQGELGSALALWVQGCYRSAHAAVGRDQPLLEPPERRSPSSSTCLAVRRAFLPQTPSLCLGSKRCKLKPLTACSFAPKDGDCPHFGAPAHPWSRAGGWGVQQVGKHPSKPQGQAKWGKVSSCLYKARQGDRGRQEPEQEEDSHTVKASAGTEVAALASPSPVFPVRCVA